MYEAIIKTPAGPLWALLVKTAIHAGFPVPIRDLYEKLDGAGAPSWITERVIGFAHKGDPVTTYDWIRRAIRPANEEDKEEDAKMFFAFGDALTFQRDRSWTWALRLARALKDLKSVEAVACCLLATVAPEKEEE